MRILRKVWQRSIDPVFYRKRFRDFIRRFRRFDDQPKVRSIEPLGSLKRAVVFVAHPDDETFCSGLICHLVETGVEVHVLCLTRGEGGPTGGATRAELGRVREEEMRRACAILGVARIEFLDHVDPVAGEFRVFAPDVSAADLAAQVRPFLKEADLLISHGSSGEYWHPAHLLVHRASRMALVGSDDTTWLTFLARNPIHPIPRLVNGDDPVYLDLEVDDRGQVRWEALSCHASQLSLFAKFAGGTSAEDFVEKTERETYCLQHSRATDPETVR